MSHAEVLAVEQAAKAGYQAEERATLLIARHLRIDHGMSRRKTAKAVDRRESWVRKHIDERI